MEPGSKPTVTKLVWRRHHTAAVVLIAVVTFAAHGWSLDDGLFLDDHWHQLKLREAEWSIRDLIDSTTIEPARWIHAWWQDQEVRWDYSRPVTMAWMKLVQDLSGGSVPLQHLSCIAWHFVCCVLVYVLCMRVTCSVFWSVFAGILFVIYPHNVYAVSWLAAQNAVIQTTLTLAAVLCYLRASGLILSKVAGESRPSSGVVGGAYPTSTNPEGAEVRSRGRKPLDDIPLGHEAPEGRQRSSHRHAETSGWPTSSEVGDSNLSRSYSGSRRWLIATLTFYVLSLFARENAVVLPVLLMAFDAAFGGRSAIKARWKWHVGFLGITGAFIIWRMSDFDSRIPEIYLRRPEDATYLSWLLAKFLHYVACVIWEAPMMIGPTRHADPFGSAFGDCLLMMFIVFALGGGYWLACRRCVRGYWMWGVWILLAILPVLPIMATPHSGYLAGVGFVIAVVLKPASVSARRARFSTAVAWWMMGLSLFAFTVYRLAWQSILAAEKYTISQMTANQPPPADSHLFIINLPLVNIYLPVNLWQAWEYPATDGPVGGIRPTLHVLTYAPHMLQAPEGSSPVNPEGSQRNNQAQSPEGVGVISQGRKPLVVDPRNNLAPQGRQIQTCGGEDVNIPTRLESVDAYSFVLTAGDQPYFGGALGEFLTQAMRRERAFRTGEVIRGQEFDVQIVEVDQRGVWRLRFVFREPLASPHYRFYLITEDCPGAHVDFAEGAGAAHPTIECADIPGADTLRRQRDILPRIIAFARKIIRTDLYLTDHQW